MTLNTHVAKLATLAVAVLWSASAQAANDPSGLWIDADKRGVVEISPCASGVGICGYVVYVFDEKNAKNCGLQILNEVTEDGGGWIYSPQRKNRYDVRLKRLNDEELRVVGNANSRFFSRTMIWHRAPDNLLRCDKTAAAAPAAAKPATAEAKDETKLVPTSASDAIVDDKATDDSGTKVAKTETDNTTKPATETASTTPAASSSEDEDTGSGKRKTCKYRIPYINRTISAPCRH